MEDVRKAKVISPRYPMLSLREAIELSEKILHGAGRGPLPREAASEAMGYSPSSSGSRRSMASLLAYGLWEKAGEGSVRLATRGRLIHADPSFSDPRVRAELREAALDPELHRAISEKYPEGLPGDDKAFATALRLAYDFNATAVQSFVRQIRDTFAFAGIGRSDTLTAKPETSVEPVEPLGEAAGLRGGAREQTKPARAAHGAEDGKMRSVPIGLVGGDVSVTYPHPLSAQDFAMLLQWMKLLEARFTTAEQEKRPAVAEEFFEDGPDPDLQAQ